MKERIQNIKTLFSSPKKVISILSVIAMVLSVFITPLMDLPAGRSPGTGKVYAAENLTGTAYAVFNSDTGELDFIRSTESHKNGDTGTVKSISGGSYTGTIYTEIETTYFSSLGGNPVPWKNIVQSVLKIKFIDVIKPISVAEWFQNMTACTSADILKLDTSKVEFMDYLFANCSSLTKLNASNLTGENLNSNGTSYVFYNCSKLKLLDISNFYNTWGRIDSTFLEGCTSLCVLKLGDKFNPPFTKPSYFFPSPTETISGNASDGKWGLDSEFAQTSYTADGLYDHWKTDHASLKGTWYAQSKEKTYKISFYSNNTEMKQPALSVDNSFRRMATQEIQCGTSTPLSKSSFVRYGYDFAGWNTKADGSGTSYKDEEAVKDLAAPGSSVKLYAQWKPKTYPIHYNSNGGEGTMSDSSITEDQATTIANNQFTRKGYIFKGWNTKADGSGILYKAGQKAWNVTGQLLTNRQQTGYDASKVTDGVVKNNATGITATLPEGFDSCSELNGSMALYRNGISTTSGKQYKLSMFAATDGTTALRPLIGARWTEEPDSSVSDDDGTRELSGAIIPRGTTNWTYLASDFLISDSFTDKEEPALAVTLYGSKGSDYSNTGCYFTGLSVRDMSVTSTTLYAQWEPKTYKNGIAHWLTGVKNQEGNNGNKEAFHLGDSFFEGVFGQGTTLDSSKGIVLPNGVALSAVLGYTDPTTGKWVSGKIPATIIQPDKAVHYEYYYIPIAYKLTYNLLGGSNDSANPSSYNILYGVTLKDAKRTGYTFNGWTDKSGKKVTGINEGANATFSSPDDLYSKLAARLTGDITLNANWTVNDYKVKFNANGGSGTMADEGMTYDTAKALTANSFKKTGYTFTGWNTKADGSGTTYEDKASVKNLVSEKGGTVTLYAQWKVNTYHVKYNANGGSGTMADQSVQYDSNFVTTKNSFTKTGYKFNGWNEKADGTGTAWKLTGAGIYENGDGAHPWKWTYDKDVTLYSQWTPNTYTVKFDPNRGTGTMANETMTYDTAKALTANSFTNKDYDFIGWNTKADGSGAFYTDKASVKNLATSGTVTLYAQWNYNPHVFLPKSGGKGIITLALISAFCILAYAEREILKKRKEVR